MRTVYSDSDICTEISSLTFHVLKIMYEEISEPIPAHSHGAGCYELHFVVGGKGRIRIRDSRYETAPGYFYVTGPHVPHEQIPEEGQALKEYCLYISVEQKKQRKPAEYLKLFKNTAAWYGQDACGAYLVVERIRQELTDKKSGYADLVSSLIQQLIIACVRNYESESPAGSLQSGKILSKSKSIITEDSFLFDYKTLTLTALSERLSLSPRQTQRYLKDVYGRTFQEKIAEAKMSAAANLLTETGLKISEISEAVGYSEPEHFSYAFKRFYGMSVTAYRKSRIGM